MNKIAILTFALMLGASPLALAQTDTSQSTTTAPATEMNKSADPNAPATQSTEQTAPSATQQSTEQTAPSTDQKATTETAPAPSAEQKTTTETAPSTEQSTTQTETAPSTEQSTTTAQAPMPAGKEHLGSEIIGATVYSPSGDNIGDVNDLVVSEDGKVSMVVIGVGGFLGMGEKNVGVEMSRLRFEMEPAAPATTDTSTTTTTTTTATPPASDAAAADNWRIVLDTTADELKTMPDFDRSKY